MEASECGLVLVLQLQAVKIDANGEAKTIAILDETRSYVSSDDYPLGWVAGYYDKLKEEINEAEPD